MIFELTNISTKHELLAQKDIDDLRTKDQMMRQIVFPDPNFLNFLGLSDSFAEKILSLRSSEKLDILSFRLGHLLFSWSDRNR